MLLKEQMKNLVKNRLEEKYVDHYGVSVELDSEDKEVEIYVRPEKESEEPEIEDMVPELAESVGILEPETEKYRETEYNYWFRISENR